MSSTSTYEWGVDYDADVQRILNANMPDNFWRAVAGVYDDLPSAQRIPSCDIQGDTFEFHTTYVHLLRGGRRVRGFNSRKALYVAYEQRKAAQAEETARARKARDDTKIIWDSE